MVTESQRSSAELDDVADREELRNRYEMLLQECRVVLPGVQVLSAFLLTAPFSQRFDQLDDWGRRAYVVAMVTSMVSVVSLMTPAMLHRIGDRTARSARLSIGIATFIGGMVFLAVALVSAMWAVMRFVFGTGQAWWYTLPLLAVLVILWVVVPRLIRPRRASSR